MKTIKTIQLTRAALDWAVVNCLGGSIRIEHGVFLNQGDGYDFFTPSTDWAQGGPIIEREGITLRCGLHGWDAELEEFDAISHGPTALIAAMRCYVASKLGEEVQIPEEFVV